jgi:tRNA(Arg) A34 adenosine deaminase TadA
MRMALEAAQRGIAAGQSPFGCAIAIGEQVVAVEHNTVRASVDATAHAEINALRTACLHVEDVHLIGAVVATTCEPCPMCLAALYWARVDTIYFGATIEDAAAAGFNELPISAAEMVRLSGSSLKLVPGPLRDDCRRLFDQWRARPGSQPY